jgi:PucR family transcriptional regulator, purine catabolism regulatory protein
MYMTVQETLELPALRELEVLGGASGLTRPVSRVSVLEVPEVGSWSRGGELFMSTLYALRGECERQCTVLRNMYCNQAAALVLHPGFDGAECVEELTSVADECGFPLIMMPQDMPYAVVTDAVMGGLVGRQAAFIQRSAAIHRDLIQMTLRGEDLDALCRMVSRRTQRPVAVVSPDGLDVLAHGGSLPGMEKRIEDLLQHRSRFSHQRNAVSVPIHSILDTGGPDHVLKTTIATPYGTITQVAAPVIAGSEIAAYLVTWELGESLTEFDLSVLAHACTSVGLVVLRRRAVMEAEHRVQQDFYGAAISGEFDSIESASYRADGAGITIAESYLVAAFACDHILSDMELGELHRWPGSVAVSVGNLQALVLHVPAGEAQPVRRGIELLTRFGQNLWSPAGQPRIGISSLVSNILQLPLALNQATTALSTAEQAGIADRVVAYEDLGVFQLLGQVRDQPLLRCFAADILGQVMELRGGDELIRTLEAFLDNHGSHLAAAETLSVHPNTVKYRIERIREILGDDALQDPHRRLGLHLALKAQRMIEQA